MLRFRVGLGHDRPRSRGRRRPAFHPLLQHRDLLARQRTFRGHRLEIQSRVADGLDQGALVHLARNHRRPRVSAGQPARGLIEAQPGFDLIPRLSRVALVAPFGEQGPDLLFEKLKVPGRRRGAQRSTGQQQPADEHEVRGTGNHVGKGDTNQAAEGTGRRSEAEPRTKIKGTSSRPRKQLNITPRRASVRAASGHSRESPG